MANNPRAVENLTAPRYVKGQSGNPNGRPKGSSVLAPLLRKLAAEPNEHGEGKEAVQWADLILAQSRMLATGVPKDEHYDLGPAFKLLDRTDPETKRTQVQFMGNGAVTPGVDE